MKPRHVKPHLGSGGSPFKATHIMSMQNAAYELIARNIIIPKIMYSVIFFLLTLVERDILFEIKPKKPNSIINNRIAYINKNMGNMIDEGVILEYFI